VVNKAQTYIQVEAKSIKKEVEEILGACIFFKNIIYSRVSKLELLINEQLQVKQTTTCKISANLDSSNFQPLILPLLLNVSDDIFENATQIFQN
jgi:hypothetical protein